MKTYVPKPHEVPRAWFVVDATGLPLGRLASRVAAVLRGKHKPQFTPHTDTGDFVVVINAEKVRLTGNKLDTKSRRYHTGHPGGLKSTTYRALMAKSPDRVIEWAVQGMLPHNYLGRRQGRKLHVYCGADHPHAAQAPRPLTLTKTKQ